MSTRHRTRLLQGLALVAGIVVAGCGTEKLIPIDDGGAKPVPVVTIAGKYSVTVGKTEKLTATTALGSDSGYTWATSNDKIATVAADGTVTGVAAGEVEISATGKDTAARGVHGMTVLAVVPPPTPTILIAGEFTVMTNATTRLTATTQNGADTGYDWSSSDAKIAAVAADGTVTGVAPGKVTITAKGKTTMASGSFGMVVANDVPNLIDWAGSKHADKTAEAFNDWNNTGPPPAVPKSCARCHSTPGFQDYVGADGSTQYVVDKDAPIGTVIDCKACHNQAAQGLTQVTFPSGVTITGLGKEAICMTCHQGRASTDSVNTLIATAAAQDDDTVSAKLTFQNIHYYAAGATLNAGRVRGGYQYTGKTYDWRFRHVPEKDTCVECHNPHSLQLDLVGCAKCHAGITKKEDLRNVRMMSSLTSDYDGDGNLTEGLWYEIDGLRTKLLAAIQGYAATKTPDKICYSPTAYPYFFKDTNGDGNCDAQEAMSANSYKQWTNRLVRAAYNYQVSVKDPGAFAHNGKYIVELLYDSIENVNVALAQKVDLSKCVRSDAGHFNGAGEPARHWDQNQAVDQGCAKCHGGSDGFRFFQKYGVGYLGGEPDNGLDCYTCHDGFGLQPADFTLQAVPSVLFPSNITIKPDAQGTPVKSALSGSSFICMTCHSGRESKATLDAAFATGKFGFRNIHYLAAGASLLGKEAQVGYEYAGQTYAGRWNHTGGINCTVCHSGKNTKHTFQVADNIATCQQVCHNGIAKLDDIRVLHTGDYDGDGKTNTALKTELAGLAGKVLAQMQTVVKNGGASGICYDGATYPYWFKDTNGNNTCDNGENVNANSFAPWTAQLSKAAFNYQFFMKEPGAWAHNFNYMGELLFDAVTDLGGSTQGLTRP